MAWPLPPLGGPVMRALPDVNLMTLVLDVASDRPACLYGWSVGFGPWAHGMALAPLGGPVFRALPSVILMT